MMRIRDLIHFGKDFHKMGKEAAYAAQPDQLTDAVVVSVVYFADRDAVVNELKVDCAA